MLELEFVESVPELLGGLLAVDPAQRMVGDLRSEIPVLVTSARDLASASEVWAVSSAELHLGHVAVGLLVLLHVHAAAQVLH